MAELFRPIFCLIGIPFGWLILFVRYRSKEERKRILWQEYGGDYSSVFWMNLAKLVGLAFGTFIIFLIVMAVIELFK